MPATEEELKAREVKIRRIAGCILILLAGAMAAWFARNYRLDDAMILFRYSKHLAEGQGWAYNPGEVHNGSTSPLFTILLAVIGKPFNNYPLVAHLLSSVFATAGALLAAYALASCGYAWAGLLAGIYLVTNLLLVGTYGLETQAFLCFSLGASIAAADSRWKWAYVMATLACLTRADGALLLLGIFALHIYRERRFPVWPILLSLGLALPWLLYSYWTFGTVLPATLSAKMAQGDSGLWGNSYPFLRYSWVILSQPYYGRWFTLGPFFLALIGLFFAPGAILLLTIVSFAQTMLYGFMNVPNYHWYYAPAVFCAILLAATAVQRLAGSLPKALTVLFLALAFTFAAWQIQWLWNTPLGGKPHYVAVGEWLKRNARPDQSVAAFEVGTIGWHSNLRVVDPLGLVTPGATSHVRKADMTWWLEVHRPDYIVLHRRYWGGMEEPVIKDPTFKRKYSEIFYFGEEQADQVVIYKRSPT